MKLSIFLLTLGLAFNINAQEKISEPSEGEEKSVNEIIQDDSSRTEEAQENTPLVLPEDKFAAIVQHLEGKPYVSKKPKKNYLDFKDLIRFGETIVVPKTSARLKIITQKRCVAVLYANTKVIAPQTKESAWQVEQGSVRWICPEDRVEKLEYKKNKLEIRNGEVLISKNQLVTLRPKVYTIHNSLEQELAFESMYTLKKSGWVSAPKQKDSYELYTYEKNYPSPSESSRRSISPPIDPNLTRVYLALAPLGWGGLLHHEKDNDFSDYEMRSYALKLAVNIPYKEKSLLTFLEFGGAQNNDSNKGPQGPLPLGYKSIDSEYVFLGAGLRHRHKRSSSYYYFGGIGFQRFDFSLKPELNEDYHGSIKHFWNIGAGIGYHKIFWHNKPISLVVGTEFKILQTLSQGKIDRFSSSPGAQSIDPKSMMTTGYAHVYLGPVFNF